MCPWFENRDQVSGASTGKSGLSLAPVEVNNRVLLLEFNRAALGPDSWNTPGPTENTVRKNH